MATASVYAAPPLARDSQMNASSTQQPFGGDFSTQSAPPTFITDGMVQNSQGIAKPAHARYTKHEHELLGQGACKKVYKAFDEEDGIEVAWNEVTVTELASATEKERDRVFAEIRLLKQLKHKNILTLYDWWFDKKSSTLIFITELFMDGSLRSYRRKHKNVDTSVLKRWAWQILQGLVYLHGHNPPIIHRDLKSDNIFVNGASGTLKIGDLGFATFKAGFSGAMSVIGTPEFMAPELYEERYNEKVDVYSFGMCLLELAVLEYPYAECRNAAQIFKKVTQGIAPQGLAKIQDTELREFVQLCISHDATQRPEARQLLKHPFFDQVRDGGLLRKGALSAALVASPFGSSNMAAAAAAAAAAASAAATAAATAALVAGRPTPLSMRDVPGMLMPTSTGTSTAHTPAHSTLFPARTSEEGGGGGGGGVIITGGVASTMNGTAPSTAASTPTYAAAAAAAPSSTVHGPFSGAVTAATDAGGSNPHRSVSVTVATLPEAQATIQHLDQGQQQQQHSVRAHGQPPSFSSSQVHLQGAGSQQPAGSIAAAAGSGHLSQSLLPSRSSVQSPFYAGALHPPPLSERDSSGSGAGGCGSGAGGTGTIGGAGGGGRQGTGHAAGGGAAPSASASPKFGANGNEEIADDVLFEQGENGSSTGTHTPRHSGTGSPAPVRMGIGPGGPSRSLGSYTTGSGQLTGQRSFGKAFSEEDLEPGELGQEDTAAGGGQQGPGAAGGVAGYDSLAHALAQRVRLACRTHQDNMLSFSMSFVNHQGTRKKVGFQYDMDLDTAGDVATEMVENLSLNMDEAGFIANLIQREIVRLQGTTPTSSSGGAAPGEGGAGGAAGANGSAHGAGSSAATPSSRAASPPSPSLAASAAAATVAAVSAVAGAAAAADAAAAAVAMNGGQHLTLTVPMPAAIGLGDNMPPLPPRSPTAISPRSSSSKNSAISGFASGRQSRSPSNSPTSRQAQHQHQQHHALQRAPPQLQQQPQVSALTHQLSQWAVAEPHSADSGVGGGGGGGGAGSSNPSAQSLPSFSTGMVPNLPGNSHGSGSITLQAAVYPVGSNSDLTLTPHVQLPHLRVPNGTYAPAATSTQGWGKPAANGTAQQRASSSDGGSQHAEGDEQEPSCFF